MLGGAVILLQADDPGILVLLFKIQDILDIGPPEAVDGLIVIAHHAEVPTAPRQQACEQILQMVCVLILVHQHVAELFLVIVQHLRLLLQQRYSVVDDVIKVQRVGRAEFLLIGGVNFSDAGHAPVIGGLRLFTEHLRPLVAVLGGADGREHTADGERFLVQILLLENVFHHPLGIVGIVNGEILVEADAVNVPPQDADAGRVERGGPDIVGGRPQPGRQTLLQLPRRLVGKRDGNDLPWAGHSHGAKPMGPLRLRLAGPLRELLQKREVLLRGPIRHLVAVAAPAIGQKVVNPLDEHGGLTAAGACQQQQRPLRGHGPLPLHGVQPGQIPGDDRLSGRRVALFKISHGVLL